jgi:hypothetical protein
VKPSLHARFRGTVAGASHNGLPQRYRLCMAESLAAIGDVLAIAILVGLVALLAWALYWAIGPQVFGLPAMIALLVIAAGVTAFSNVGVAALAAVLIGLALIVVVIGMAMNVGAKRAGRSSDARRKDDLY